MDDFREAVWAAVPEDAEPERLALRRAFLLEHVPRGATVVDLGCGAGEFAAVLVDAGTRVIAVDVAREALRQAAERVPWLDARRWLAGEPLPAADAIAEAVWAGEVIEHVVDVGAWLSEVRRVLVPGGTLLLTTPHHGPGRMLRLALSRRAFAEHFEPRADHLRFFSPRTLRSVLEEQGFAVESLRAAGGSPLMRSTLLARARRR